MRGHGPWRIAWWLSEVRMPQLVHFLTRKSHFFFPSPREIAISILDTNRDACFLGRAGALEKSPYLACMKPRVQSLVLKGKQNKPHSQIQNPKDFSVPKVSSSCPLFLSHPDETLKLALNCRLGGVPSECSVTV